MIENKAKIPSLLTSLQQCTGGPIQCNEVRKININHKYQNVVKLALSQRMWLVCIEKQVLYQETTAAVSELF